MIFKSKLLKTYEMLKKDYSMEYLEEVERKNFRIPRSEKQLNKYAGLVREYLRIANKFAYGDYSKVSFKQSNKMNKMLEQVKLSIKYGDFDYNVMTEMIVILDVMLGVQVSYCTALHNLMLQYDVEELCKVVRYGDFEVLYRYLSEVNNGVNV